MEILIIIVIIATSATITALIIGAGALNEALKELEEEEDDRFFN